MAATAINKVAKVMTVMAVINKVAKVETEINKVAKVTAISKAAKAMAISRIPFAVTDSHTNPTLPSPFRDRPLRQCTFRSLIIKREVNK